MMKTTIQTLRKENPDGFVLAEKYYSVISVLNNLHLTEREIQLVAFTAMKGNISYGSIREEFCKKFATSSPTINNMISRLKKIGVMVKVGGKVKVNPKLVIDFESDVVIMIQLTHGES